MPKIHRPRTSRRVRPLKDSDYDHEIHLVDNGDAVSDSDDAFDSEDDAGPSDAEENGATEANADNANANNDGANDAVVGREENEHDNENENESDGSQSPPLITTQSFDPADYPHSAPPIRQVPTGATLASETAPSTAALLSSTFGRNAVDEPPRGRRSEDSNRASKTASAARVAPTGHLAPYTSARNPDLSVRASRHGGRASFQSARSEAQSAIDILYENERGGFLCGLPLFSGRALGNLDPPNWTNYAHNPSPTNTTNAQVPDPSWEWAWPEWRINHDNGADEDGWEYSFMFAKCFSWHGPNWYGSFVRRRAWIRKRVKRPTNMAAAVGLRHTESAMDPNLLNPDYFTILPTGSIRRSTSRASSSRAVSRVGSRGSTGAASQGQASRSGIVGRGRGDEEAVADGDDGGFAVPSEIDNTDVLMQILRTARIDREKIEAMDNFLEHSGEDLVRLQDVMHEIMALFVFQASRRTLLTHLKKAYSAAVEEKKKKAEEGEAEEEEAVPGGTEAGKENRAVDQEPTTTTTTTTTAAAAAAPVDEKGKGKAGDESTPEPAPKLDASKTANGSSTKYVTDAATDRDHLLQALGRRVGYLAAAVHHADEEVRRLEYWSDVRAMAKADALGGPSGGPSGGPGGAAGTAQGT